MSTALRVLIVEDSEDDATLIALELQRGGFELKYARVDTAAEMREVIRQQPWEIVISDFSMPHFSAFDALKIAKEHDPDIPFIIVSGTIGEDVAVEAMRAGASDYVMKGNVARLIPAIQRELRDAEQRRTGRATQAALVESEERLAQIARTVEDVFWIIDWSTQKALFVSSAYEKVWGHELTDVYAGTKRWGDSVHPDDHERVLERFQKLGEGEAYDEVYRIVRPDGSERWIRDRGFPIRNEANEVVRVSGIAQDITVQKKSEDQVREKEGQLNDLLSNVGVIILEGTEHTIEFVGGQVERILGYPLEDWHEHPEGPVGFWASKLHPDDLDKVEKCAREILEGHDHVFEYRMIASDGHEVWFYDTVTVDTSKGKPYKTRAVMVDITERKLAEKVIRETEAEFRAVLENSPDQLYKFNIQTGKYDYMSPAVESMIGVSVEEFLAGGLEFAVSFLHPDDKEMLDDHVNNLMTRRLESDFERTIEYRLKHPTLGYRWYSDNRTVLYDDDGSPVSIVGSSRDITLRRLAEQALLDSESKYHHAIDALHEGVVYQLADGSIQASNESAQRILGLSADQMAGRTSLDPRWRSIHEDGTPFPGETHPMMHTLRTGAPTSNVIMGIHHPTGELVWISISCNPLFHEGESLPYAAVGLFSDITERKISEEQLRESTELLQATHEANPDLQFMIAPDGVIMSYHANDDSDLYKSPENFLGKRMQDVLPEKVGDQIVAAFDKATSTGSMVTIEYELPMPDCVRSYEARIAPLPDQRLVLTVRDITERKSSEREMERLNSVLKTLGSVHSEFAVSQDSKASFEALLAILLDVTDSEYGFIGECMHQPDGTPYLKTRSITDISWNEETAAFYQENAPTGLEFFNLKSLFGEVLVTGKTVIANKPATDPRRTGIPEGHPDLNAFMGVPLLLGDELVGMVGIANRLGGYDETINSLLDPILKTSAHLIGGFRVQAERERLASAIEQSAESVVITDAKGTIQFVNPAFERTTGYSREEAVGKHPRILRSGEHDEAFYKDLWDTLESGKTWSGEIVNRKKDGTLFSEEMTISPVVDSTGATINYVAVQRDVTHELALQAHLNQAQKMESIGRLAGGVAHDLNNLLTPILCFSELLEQDLNRDTESSEFAKQIHRAGIGARDLVRQLLAFSRKQTLEVQSVDLSSTVRDFESLLRHTIKEDVSITTSLESDISPVRADVRQIEQVIMNLVVNAADAVTESGEIQIDTANATLDEDFVLAHEGATAGEYVMLTVTDNGSGMDDETLKQVFEPFFSTKGEKGTGLGLSTVYGIVKQHGGYVAVDSTVGKGTTFSVYMPVFVGQQPEAKPTSRVRHDSNRSETVIVVEDYAPLKDLIKTILVKHGYTVIVASNGVDALSKLEALQKPADLLLTDVVMPKMGGSELFSKARKKCPAIKVLYMSGYSQDEISKQGVLFEGIDFIQKPFTLEGIATKVNVVLDKE